MIQVPGQTELTPDFILTKLNISNTDGAITITTAPNAITFSLENIANLNVNNTFTANTVEVSSFNNVNIGTLVPLSGTFTELTATGAVSAVSNNQQISLAPTGTGTVVIKTVRAVASNAGFYPCYYNPETGELVYVTGV